MAWFTRPVVGALVAIAAAVGACSVTDGVVGPGSGTLPNAGDGSTGPALDAGSCSPADESQLTPTWHPSHAHRDDCTSDQIDSLFACLKDSATQSSPPSCAPWGATMSTANRTCYQCIVTDDAQPEWGPLIVHSGLNTEETNYAGCAALVEGVPDGGGCGGKVAADVACESAACAVSCPVDSSGNGLDGLNACITAADRGTCSAFATAAACLGVDSGPLAACNELNYADALTAARAVAVIFCGAGGGGIPDGGGD
jgi:hypothetical protein